MPERGEPCFEEATKRFRELAGDRLWIVFGPRSEDRYLLAPKDLTRSVRLLTPLLAELSSVFTRQGYRKPVGYNS